MLWEKEFDALATLAAHNYNISGETFTLSLPKTRKGDFASGIDKDRTA